MKAIQKTYGFFNLSKFLLACIVVIVPALCSCTRNNGDIGPWFGMWQLLEVQTNGVADADYEGNIFWAFQNNVFQMILRSTEPGDLTRDQRWGTWQESDGMLILDFNHYEDLYPEGYVDGYNIYVPFPQTHLPYGEASRLNIVKMKGSDMVLTYSPQDSEVVYTYILKKR